MANGPLTEALNLSTDSPTAVPQTAANVYTIPYLQTKSSQVHTPDFFSPTIATLLKAINNDKMDGMPFMKPELIQRHLPPLAGHVERPHEKAKGGDPQHVQTGKTKEDRNEGKSKGHQDKPKCHKDYAPPRPRQ